MKKERLYMNSVKHQHLTKKIVLQVNKLKSTQYVTLERQGKVFQRNDH